MKEEVIVHDPKNQKPINELFVYMSRDSDGNEGIIAMPILNYGTSALAFGNIKIAEMIEPVVRQFIKHTNKQVWLCKFTEKSFLKRIE